jgi:hypothetical protein
MAKTKISEFSATPANNTDIDSINIAEGCAPSGINDAIRELMAQLKDFQTGAVGDSFNGPIGTTTAAAGAFTTLSSTGNTTLGDASGDAITVNGTATFANANPTLTAGTANGVTYLNGSKVLTSGSALTFDGTTIATTGKFGITGNGSIPTASALEIGSNGAGTRFRYNIPTGGEHNFTENGSVISFQNTNAHGWLIAGSEGMRLTSTGLGIGTSSPAEKLEVSGGANTAIRVTASSGNSVFRYARGGVDKWTTYVPSTDDFIFYSNVAGTERGRFDASGNLGIGTSSPSAKLHVEGSMIGGTQRFEALSKTVAVGSSVNFDISAGSAATGFVRVRIAVGYVGDATYQMHAQYAYITINYYTGGGTATRENIYINAAGNAQFNYTDISVSRPSDRTIRITYAPTSGSGTHTPYVYVDGVFASLT